MASGVAVEAACANFDSVYDWSAGAGAGAPGRPSGADRGLRDLWAYFIDVYLERIEVRAQQWGTDAKAAVLSKFHDPTKPHDEASDWADLFFSSDYPGGQAQLKFHQPNPQAAVGMTGKTVAASKYGMWNNPSGPWVKKK